MKIFILTLAMLISSFAFTAEEGVKLPKAADVIVGEMNATKTKATIEAIKKLQKVQGDLTKKSDLEGAMSIKKFIEDLQKSIEKESPATTLFTKAEWGLGNTWIDVTPDIVALIKNEKLAILTLVGELDESLRRKYSDPAPNSHKFLRFTFSDDKSKKTFSDDSSISLPLK